MLFKDIIKKQGNYMDTSINILNFIREITDSDEEFLAVIEEMNKWMGISLGRENEEIEKRIFYIPNNIRRFNFTRDEYREAFNIATKSVSRRKTDTHHRKNISKHRENKSPSYSSLLW